VELARGWSELALETRITTVGAEGRRGTHPHDQSSILLPDVIHFRLRNVE
jgi:hypothetical protein